MISRLIRNLTLAALLIGELTACDQLFGPTTSSHGESPFQAVSNRFSPNRSASGATVHGYNPHGALLTSQKNADDPPMDPHLMGGHGNFWDHLRANFKIPPADNQPQVQAQINWFLHNRDYLDHTIRRAAPYMYFIMEETQKRNLPAELVLLPINESAYNPFVSSYRGASGLWQLMPGTASGLGIKQDWWFDGRRDIYASTSAALDYLTYLQSFFGGDWELAIAAYDTGEGNVQNAVRRNTMRGDNTDFWSLSLARETRSYVPRLLALAAIIRDPERYGVTLPPISDQPYLEQVDLGVAINLAQAAQLAGMSLAELKQLNPGYNRMTTDPNGPYKLLLPIDRIALFKEQLASLPAVAHTTWGHYKIQHGDTLLGLAKRFDIAVGELKSMNHIKVHYAPVGKVIMVPTGTQTAVPRIDENALKQGVTEDNAKAPEQNNQNVQQSVSEVLGGSSAASPNFTSRDQTSDDSDDQDQTQTSADQNQNDQGDLAEQSAELTPSQHAKESSDGESTQKQVHVLKRGETLFSLARRYNVKPSDLARWNKIKVNKPLKPGMKIIILKNESASETGTNSGHMKSTHHGQASVVQKGNLSYTQTHTDNNKLAHGHHAKHVKSTHTSTNSNNKNLAAAKHSGKIIDTRKRNHVTTT